MHCGFRPVSNINSQPPEHSHLTRNFRRVFAIVLILRLPDSDMVTASPTSPLPVSCDLRLTGVAHHSLPSLLLTKESGRSSGSLLHYTKRPPVRSAVALHFLCPPTLSASGSSTFPPRPSATGRPYLITPKRHRARTSFSDTLEIPKEAGTALQPPEWQPEQKRSSKQGPSTRSKSFSLQFIQIVCCFAASGAVENSLSVLHHISPSFSNFFFRSPTRCSSWRTRAVFTSVSLAHCLVWVSRPFFTLRKLLLDIGCPCYPHSARVGRSGSGGLHARPGVPRSARLILPTADTGRTLHLASFRLSPTTQAFRAILSAGIPCPYVILYEGLG